MQNTTQTKQNRKGEAGIAMGLLTGFVVVAAVLILIIMLVYVFGAVDTGLDSTRVSQTTTNQSGYINSSGLQLANGVTGSPRAFSILIAINGSSGVVIPATNYTVGTTGILTNSSTSPAVWVNANITYAYFNNSDAQMAAESAQSNTSRSIPLIGVLFIIVAVGVILTILIVSLIGGRKS